jgi:hypothetical protein
MASSGSVLDHIGLDSGERRASQRAEVQPFVLDLLRAWLPSHVNTGRYHPLPTIGLEAFACRFSADQGALFGTIAGLRMPAPGESAQAPLLLPLVTFAAANHAGNAAILWGELMRLLPKRPDVVPTLPWCADVCHPALRSYPVELRWIPDFERCAAWAWFDLSSSPLPPRAAAAH